MQKSHNFLLRNLSNQLAQFSFLFTFPIKIHLQQQPHRIEMYHEKKLHFTNYFLYITFSHFNFRVHQLTQHFLACITKVKSKWVSLLPRSEWESQSKGEIWDIFQEWVFIWSGKMGNLYHTYIYYAYIKLPSSSIYNNVVAVILHFKLNFMKNDVRNMDAMMKHLLSWWDLKLPDFCIACGCSPV